MAFPSPRPVRSSSSKSLRTSLTSFSRPFCSFHVFRLCNPLFSLSPIDPPTSCHRSSPGLLLLTDLCRFNLKYRRSCRRYHCRRRPLLGFDSQREPPHRCSVRLHQHIRRCLAIQQGVAKSEAIGEKDYPGELLQINRISCSSCCSKDTKWDRILRSRSSHNLISYLEQNCVSHLELTKIK